MWVFGKWSVRLAMDKVQLDWSERDFLEQLIANVKKITDFLNKFGEWEKRHLLSCGEESVVVGVVLLL